MFTGFRIASYIFTQPSSVHRVVHIAVCMYRDHMIIVMFHAWLSYPWGYCRSGVGETFFVGDKHYDHDIIKHATWPDKGIIPIPAVCGNILYDRACPA